MGVLRVCLMFLCVVVMCVRSLLASFSCIMSCVYVCCEEFSLCVAGSPRGSYDMFQFFHHA